VENCLFLLNCKDVNRHIVLSPYSLSQSVQISHFSVWVALQPISFLSYVFLIDSRATK